MGNLNIFSFEPFGYDGSLLQVEADIRSGLPAVDIIGIGDDIVKTTSERVRAAIKNSGFDFPQDRVLMSVSPAGIKKTSGNYELALAAAIMNNDSWPAKRVMILGSLDLTGSVGNSRSLYQAAELTQKFDINTIICSKNDAKIVSSIDNLQVYGIENLKELPDVMNQIKKNDITVIKEAQIKVNHDDSEISFNGDIDSKFIKNTEEYMNGKSEAVRAIEIAVAGKHNIILEGSSNSGKERLLTQLIPAITPNLTADQARENARIYSCVGFPLKEIDFHKPPMRHPHYLSSLEGMVGGGSNCSPGEVSLANNGTLFLEDAPEFKSTVIQTLRIPLENKSIILSRAGRQTKYPANSQLAVSMNSCPCGCSGSSSKICICSAKAIEMFHKKVESPLLERISIRMKVSEEKTSEIVPSITELRERVATAYKIQRERGKMNEDLTPMEIDQYCKLPDSDMNYLAAQTESMGFSRREYCNTLKTALTIANLDGRTTIERKDLDEAFYLNCPFENKPVVMKHDSAAVDKDVTVNDNKKQEVHKERTSDQSYSRD